jgi:hypothetical protein
MQLKAAKVVSACRVGRAFQECSEPLAAVDVAALGMAPKLTRGHVLGQRAITLAYDPSGSRRGMRLKHLARLLTARFLPDLPRRRNFRVVPTTDIQAGFGLADFA